MKSNFEKVLDDANKFDQMFPELADTEEIRNKEIIEFAKWLDTNKNNDPEVQCMARFLAEPAFDLEAGWTKENALVAYLRLWDAGASLSDLRDYLSKLTNEERNYIAQEMNKKGSNDATPTPQ